MFWCPIYTYECHKYINWEKFIAKRILLRLSINFNKGERNIWPKACVWGMFNSEPRNSYKNYDSRKKYLTRVTHPTHVKVWPTQPTHPPYRAAHAAGWLTLPYNACDLTDSLVYTMFITNNCASFHLWCKENLVKHQKVWKYYENNCSCIVD